MDDSSMGTPETTILPVRLGRGYVRPGGERSRPGMTIIELLLAVIILGTLAAIGVSIYLNARDKAMIVQAITDISVLQQKISVYRVDNNGALPTTLSDVGWNPLRDPYGRPYQYLDLSTDENGTGGGKGGGKGGGSGGGTGGKKEKARKDRFLVPLNTDYDLYSMGKDGDSNAPLTAKASRDDIVRANNGAFIGLASDF
jgi:general secretion pathway protein G